MTIFIQQEYAERAMQHLLMYKKSIGKFSLVARCPICGDSRSNPHAARFKAYEYKNTIRVGCFRCSYNVTITSYMKEHRPDLYREFITEAYKPDFVSKKEPEVYKTKAVIKHIEQEDLLECTRLDKLPEDHPIIRYISNRMIPKDRYNRLFFTTNWPVVANSVKSGSYPIGCRPEARLVIPIYNKEGQIESIQGRSLNPKANSKYITIKKSEESSKIYGVDLIDPKKPVFVMEGPIDTLFIDNSIAITGGQLSVDEIPFNNPIFILDNEPFHEHTTKRYKYYIDQGCSVVLWDKSPWTESDVNDIIVKEGASAEEIMTYFKNNIVSGLMAELRFNNWKRI